MVDGKPTSLVDLGFVDAGIDDGWQACYSGPGGVGFHNASGYPIVNTTRFPDLRALTARARALGVRPGWYGNNDGCEEKRPACALQVRAPTRRPPEKGFMPHDCVGICRRTARTSASRATSTPRSTSASTASSTTAAAWRRTSRTSRW